MRIGRISKTIEERVANFKDMETDFGIFSNPFPVNAEEVPQNIKWN